MPPPPHPHPPGRDSVSPPAGSGMGSVRARAWGHSGRGRRGHGGQGWRGSRCAGMEGTPRAGMEGRFPMREAGAAGAGTVSPRSVPVPCPCPWAGSLLPAAAPGRLPAEGSVRPAAPLPAAPQLRTGELGAALRHGRLAATLPPTPTPAQPPGPPLGSPPGSAPAPGSSTYSGTGRRYRERPRAPIPGGGVSPPTPGPLPNHAVRAARRVRRRAGGCYRFPGSGGGPGSPSLRRPPPPPSVRWGGCPPPRPPVPALVLPCPQGPAPPSRVRLENFRGEKKKAQQNNNENIKSRESRAGKELQNPRAGITGRLGWVWGRFPVLSRSPPTLSLWQGWGGGVGRLECFIHRSPEKSCFEFISLLAAGSFPPRK